jgi:hypothetical protein
LCEGKSWDTLHMASAFIEPYFLLIECPLAGGSTVVVLFEKGVVEWDEDLLVNGRAALETLVRVRMGVGRRQHVHVHPAIARKASPLSHSRSNSRPRSDREWNGVS